LTKDGPEKLPQDIPSDPDAIERLIARARSALTAIEAGGR
jgi:hypothetical protein